MTWKRDFHFGPFGGIVDDVPRPYKPPGDFDDLLNFVVREGRLQTRPNLSTFSDPPDQAILRVAVSFKDVLQLWHTLFLTTRTAYAITAGPTYNTLTLPGGISLGGSTGTGLPYRTANLQGKLFFSNGSCNLVYADGSSAIQATVDVPGTCRFMAPLASHLLTAYQTEPAPGVVGSQIYPYRVRWSKSGDATIWTGVSSAGFNDLLDIPDEITGLLTLGRNCYVFRTNGITTIAPIGPAGAPFIFDNQSISPKGIGNYYPYSLDSFGSWAAFVAQDDIYIFDGSSFTPIGGGARKKIFSDLLNNSRDVVQGWIVPGIGIDYPYLSYWLSIPGPNITWVFSRASGKWQRFSWGQGWLTCLGQVFTS